MLPDITIIYLVYASPNSMLFLKGVVMDIVLELGHASGNTNVLLTNGPQLRSHS